MVSRSSDITALSFSVWDRMKNENAKNTHTIDCQELLLLLLLF